MSDDLHQKLNQETERSKVVTANSVGITRTSPGLV